MGLSHRDIDDNVTVQGGTDSTVIGNILDQFKTADILCNSGTNGEITVGVSPVLAKVGASNLANRKTVRVYNSGNHTIYFGFKTNTSTSGVNSGEPLRKRRWVEVSSNIDLYLVSNNANAKAIIIEGA